MGPGIFKLGKIKSEPLMLSSFFYLSALSSAISLSIFYFSLTFVALGRCQSSLVSLSICAARNNFSLTHILCIISLVRTPWPVGYSLLGAPLLHWWSTLQLYTLLLFFCLHSENSPPTLFWKSLNVWKSEKGSTMNIWFISPKFTNC